MPLPLCQLPDEPAVHSPEGKLPCLRSGPRAINVVQNPVHLAAGEISVRNQPRLGLNQFAVAAFPKRIAELRRSPVLPHNRVVDRLPRLPIPHDGGLTLIGNPDSRNVALGQISRRQSLGRDATLRRPNLSRRMLHPSWLRKDLAKRPVRYRYNLARFTHHHGSRTCRPLIQRQNVFFIRQVALLKSSRRRQTPIPQRKRCEQLYLIRLSPHPDITIFRFEADR